MFAYFYMGMINGFHILMFPGGNGCGLLFMKTLIIYFLVRYFVSKSEVGSRS